MASETLKQKTTLDEVLTDIVSQTKDLITPDSDGNRDFDENLILIHAVKDLTDKYNSLLKLINPVPTSADYKVAELKTWLDDRGVSYTKSDTKTALLSKCANPHDPNFQDERMAGDSAKSVNFAWDGSKLLKVTLTDSSNKVFEGSITLAAKK